MTARPLLDTALINAGSTGARAFGDRLFAWWFDRLVYAQIWEDPVADLDALAIQPGDRIVTIASGGCNALAYLSTRAAQVHAVDLNPAHLAMLELKRCAFAHFGSHAELVIYLGDADDAGNGARFDRHIAPHLEPAARRYWMARDAWGRRRHRIFERGAYRHGLLGRFIGCAHIVARLLGGNLSAMAGATSPDEQRERFERCIAPVLDHAFIAFLLRRPSVLYSLGIPPAQYEAISRDAQRGIAEDFRERVRRLACDWPIAENPFAQQAFARRYDTAHPSALPMYLQSRHWGPIRSRLHALHVHHRGLTEFLRSRPSGSVDVFVLLDAQDWMDAAQLRHLWDEVGRTASPKARVLFRTGGSRSPLELHLPPSMLQAWETDAQLNREWHASDRSAIYGGMFLYRCRPATASIADTSR
jgi:S-adenosylmethionine-diacylglycerol 3-amino-3-carboxypropyl transferase